MVSLKKNIAANFIGKIWSAVIVILLTPQYLKYLGIEAYGLVGFYVTLIGAMAILDMGLSITLNRELAKYTHNKTQPIKDVRNLTFSLECVYWGIGLFISILIIALSGFIAGHWVRVEHLPVAVVKQSIVLMGAVVAFQWPISLYSGGLTGLEKQVFNNTLNVIMSTLRAAGVILILKYYSATLEAFFIWQAVVSLLYVAVMRWGLWKKMPRDISFPKFSKQQLKIVWRFTAGMAGIGAASFLLTQIDKIVLSKILPLAEYGYYTLAYQIASCIGMIMVPISITFFPRFAGFIAAGKDVELKQTYHKACRLMSSFLFPVAFVLVFFMPQIINVWTKKEVVTSHTYLMAEILVLGTLFNSLMVMPYSLLVAQGKTRFFIYQNIIASIIMVPLLLWLTNVYGPVGAASVWLILNTGFLIISIPLMHRGILKNELVKWYLQDTILPMLPSLIVVLMIKYGVQFFLPNLKIGLLFLAVISIISFGVSLAGIIINSGYTLKKVFKLQL